MTAESRFLLSSFSTVILSQFPHLHISSFQDGHLHSQNMNMDSTHITDRGNVVAILIINIDSEVRHVCAVTWLRHQVSAVAHEVIVFPIKGAVVWVT